MRTWILQDLETVTDDEIRDAACIFVVVFDDDREYLILPPKPGDNRMPLCLVVNDLDGIIAARDRVEKVLGDRFPA